MSQIKNRRPIISSLIIVLLISLTGIIIYQYNEYNKNEKRLIKAYENTNFQSSELYTLFSTYSEANHLFNLYAINFDKDDYYAYSQKIDTIKLMIDSLASIPAIQGNMKDAKTIDNNIASEFIDLKKQIEHLILYSKDSIEPSLNDNKITNIISRQITGPDEVLQKILNDTSLKNTNTDTVVKKKSSLFNRVFNAKNDTVVAKNSVESHISKEMNLVLRKNIDLLVLESKEVNSSNLTKLKSTFSKLKKTERDMLMSNLSLLNNLKQGIEKLRALELEKYVNHKSADFITYTNNAKSIRNQLILALSLMSMMVILIIIYQLKARSFERKLIKEKNYANALAEEKTSILGNISHEIRTPLNSLRGLINLLKNNSTSQKIDKEIISSIDHDTSLITTTINDILSLYQIEAKKSKISAEYINIHDTIEDLISLHSFHAQSKGLNLLNQNKTAKTILIKSNSFRIKQITSNLITNAIKYTEKGNITLRSELTRNSVLKISIEDTGIGISKEQLDQIFRKYYTADKSSKAGGIGLGLYISKLLAEQIGGKLSVTSSIGKGATFTFELPINSIKEDNEILHDAFNSTIKAVFIDDSKINLFFIKQLFQEKENFHYFTNPEQAINFIKENPIDIVVTDLKMPNISGWDILEYIKSNPSLSQIKVIVSTSEPLLLENNQSNFQFDSVLQKPFKEKDLLTELTKEGLKC